VHDQRRDGQRAQRVGAVAVVPDGHHLAAGTARMEAPVVRTTGAFPDVRLVEPLGLRAVDPLRRDLTLDVLLP
jgi:hypothetical protein